jgi:putative zinc finger protein
VTGPSGRPTEANGLAHLSDAELAGYLDHDLSADERRRVETHIDECAACRREIVALLPITHPGQSTASTIVYRPRRWWIPAAAAAVVAALALPRLTRDVAGPDLPQRARPVTEAGGRPHLATVAPADDATVGGRIVFTWRSTSADFYRVDVLTTSGDPVWTTDTGDTTVTVPDSVVLQAGQSYFWRVEAIGNGISAASGVHRLQIPRP